MQRHKRRAKVALDAELLAEARHLGIDVARVVDLALRRQIEKRRVSFVWGQENEAAIHAFNRYIEVHGPMGEEFRSDA
jgi:antitoxin CcdA